MLSALYIVMNFVVKLSFFEIFLQDPKNLKFLSLLFF